MSALPIEQPSSLPPWYPPELVRADLSGSTAAELIVEAAERCFAEHGTAVTLTDIARTAGVSRPTVYRYFENREQIVLEIGLRILESFLIDAVEQVRQIADPATKLRTALILLMDGRPPHGRPAVLSDPGFFWEVYAVVGQSPTYQQIARDFLERVFEQIDVSIEMSDVTEFVVRLVSTVPVRRGILTDPERRGEFIDHFLVAPILASAHRPIGTT